MSGTVNMFIEEAIGRFHQTLIEVGVGNFVFPVQLPTVSG